MNPPPAPLPVVAVPGLGLSRAAPRYTLDRLPTLGTAVVELPGFGQPAGCATPLAVGDLADLLLARLTRLGLDRAVLFGHSASCQLVAQAAAQAPQRVAALVLVGPTTDPRAGGWAGLTGRWLRTAVWERPWQVPQLVRDYHHTGFATIARAMDDARRHRIDQALAAVACPVLLLRGRHDRIAPSDWLSALAAVAPHARAETLPAGAHMVPLTHPAAVAARIRAFVVVPPAFA
ncbi:alpha/beta fold hydrolase [Pseudonocardia nigra]|uniref:alpha/beta fold hydrolase n=1 Tax=Pseudonocardia nigra TaxID=1921578 RepID=UPI001C5D53BD|nr:alpha/beta hydrolase [Pseudonocardia nigra]